METLLRHIGMPLVTWRESVETEEPKPWGLSRGLVEEKQSIKETDKGGYRNGRKTRKEWHCRSQERRCSRRKLGHLCLMLLSTDWEEASVKICWLDCLFFIYSFTHLFTCYSLKKWFSTQILKLFIFATWTSFSSLIFVLIEHTN